MSRRRRFRLSPAFQRFFARESSAGFLLALCTVIALLIANSPLGPGYAEFLHGYIGPLSLHHWINDGLMVIFFFVVGMEIKRELVEGELASPRQAALPIAAALGGMAGPALIYLALNPAGSAASGWGIPMATDIAFAVAALSLFGKRVPLSLKVFLLALAIVDDLGAVLVIAFFYTEHIAGPYLGLAALAIGAIALMKEAGIGRYPPYILVGALLWYAVLKSGVHATIAGVLLGLFTPLRFEGKGRAPHPEPLSDLVHRLHPFVNFLIMPIFALANAGVRLVGGEEGIMQNPVFLGVAGGLLLGKPLGILLFSGLSVFFKFAELPRGVRWAQLAGVGFLGGIGFTMALFVSNLALDPAHEVYAKAGIIAASTLAGLAGAALLHAVLPAGGRGAS
jgi:Na+:H+ antiporter, NhaA family